MLTPLFGPGVKSAPLANELVAALVDQGHCVHVIVLDWSGQSEGADAHHYTRVGVRIDVITPGPRAEGGSFARRMARAILGTWKGYRRTRAATRGMQYDALFAFTIATSLLGPIWAARHKAALRQLFVTDFYPFHNVEIGTLPRWLLRFGIAAETLAFRQFTRILCISPEWVRFLRRHYRVDGQASALLPLWTASDPLPDIDRAAVRKRHGLPTDKTIAIFGGQLAEGREIEAVIAAALASAERLPELLVLFVGGGPLQGLVQRSIDPQHPRVTWLSGLPHGEYMMLLRACDIGLVSLAADVKAPAFPSKSLDYLRAGLPIVAAGEPGSDFVATVEQLGIGIGVRAGDSEGIIEALGRCIDFSSHDASARAHRALADYFSVTRAAAIIAGECDPVEA